MQVGQAETVSEILMNKSDLLDRVLDTRWQIEISLGHLFLPGRLISEFVHVVIRERDLDGSGIVLDWNVWFFRDIDWYSDDNFLFLINV